MIRDGIPAGTPLAQLPTPFAVVDLERLERNLDEMAALARDAGVALRPHWKTHKCPVIARMQIARGAVGGTVAKPSEAEAFIAAGARDLVIATPVVDPAKIDRLLAIAESTGTRLAVLVESREGAALWAGGAERAGRPVTVRLEVDTGLGRTGTEPGRATGELAREIAADDRLDLEGVMTHGGQAYGAQTPEEVAEIGRAEGETLVAAAAGLREDGIPCPVVSVGSTPTVRTAAHVPGVTEIRPGNYVFHDAIQAALGVVEPGACALAVVATVLAKPAPDRILVDAGSKTLGTDRGAAGDPGFGRWVDFPEVRVDRLWEEHGVISHPSVADLAIGDRIRLIPNHACVTVNLHGHLVAARGDEVEAVWEVTARGCVA